MAYGDNSTPSRVEAWCEARFPAYRFGMVLVLLFATFVFMASGVEGAWAQVVTVVLQSLTLLAALLASRTGRHLFRIAALVSLLAVVGAVVAGIVSSSDTMVGIFFALNMLLVGAAPFVIGRALWQQAGHRRAHGARRDLHLRADRDAVLVPLLHDRPARRRARSSCRPTAPTLRVPLLQLHHADCTVGYGDFTRARRSGARSPSIEALLGQLYLVTIVAVLVSRIARAGARAARAEADEPGDAGSTRTGRLTGQASIGSGSASTRFFWSST